MDRTSSEKLQVTLAAVGVFVLGVIAGALLVNLYQGRFATGPRGRWQPSVLNVRNLTERLNLSEEQQDEVEKILEDARKQLMDIRRQSEPQVREIRSQTEERLKQVLTEDQWNRFQQVKSEMRNRHRGMRHGRSRNAPD
jgi:Spy/CpxP family protein refolding chaperone